MTIPARYLVIGWVDSAANRFLEMERDGMRGAARSLQSKTIRFNRMSAPLREHISREPSHVYQRSHQATMFA